MNMKDWDEMAQESQEWLFQANKHVQQCPICLKGLAQERWAEKTDEIMLSIRENREKYERNVLGIPDAFIY